MAVIVKASDLKFKYPRNVETKNALKFSGLSNPEPFNRNDLYEIIPMMSAVMNELGSDDGRQLHLLEEILNEMPRFIATRSEVYDYLLGSARE
jgi:hypothetical protein